MPLYQCMVCYHTQETFSKVCQSCFKGYTIVATAHEIIAKSKEVQAVKGIESAESLFASKQEYYRIKDFEFLGDFVPNERVKAILYGLPGSGKSSLLLQFADRISNKKDRSLLISYEEGAKSATLRKRVKQYNIKNANILFPEIERNAHAVIKKIEETRAKHVFIDSINKAKLKPHDCDMIAERVPGFCIFIHQSTKKGEYKGDSAYLHDCDVEIQALRISESKAIAITGKNRYGSSGAQKVIFDYEKKIDVEQQE